MSILEDRKYFDHALPSADETVPPIEAWTLDDFAKFAEFACLRVARTGMDERGE